MNKFINWTKKPITWGAYLIACMISVVISLGYIAQMFGIPGMIWDKVKGVFKK